VRLDAQNLGSLARGCALLGAGGGGDPELGLMMALTAVDQHGPVDVVALEELADDALIMPCGLVGSPAIASEKVWGGDEGRILRNAVERLRTESVAALMCYSQAGANGLLPVIWAARIGLPLVDADGMGRAFPELQQQAMHLAGVPASPVVVTDGRGNAQVLYCASDAWAERMARSAAACFGGVCAGALYCMTALEARDAAISGSLSRTVAIGEALSADAVSQCIDALCEVHDAVVVMEGSVVHVERRADDGFVRGSATIQEEASFGARQLRLELQNEFLLAIEDGVVRVAVPDLISVLSTDTGKPIATERLRRGERVVVVATPAPDLWLSPAGLSVAGPAAFGYDVDYAPLVGGSTDARR
jgi:uncharacterized protein